MRLKNATPEASYNFRVRARLSEIKEEMQSTPKAESGKWKIIPLIRGALEIAGDERALAKLRLDAIYAAAGAIASMGFTESELGDFERRAPTAASLGKAIEAFSALDSLRKAAAKSRERGRRQQALF